MYRPATSSGILAMVSHWGPWGFMPYQQLAAASASGVWSNANQAHYAPVYVPTTCVARRMWWANGDTVSATYNIDAGIYADAGHKPGVLLVSSGSTAQGTATNVQFSDITDTTLAPGLYWIAMTCSSISATFFRGASSAATDAALQFVEASALPLPATATPGESTTSNQFMFGFATTASP